MADQPKPELASAASRQTTGHTTLKKKPNFQRPKNKVPNKNPTPQYSTKKEIPFTNDPLWLHCFLVDGDRGLCNEPSAKFHPDAAGFVNLIDHEYKAISGVDKYYAKYVPASAHAYYHTVLYWYKIALISQKNGTSSREQDQLVNFVDNSNAQIAEGAGEYLEGLGDFTDATGVKHLLKAKEPNEHGHFGRATAETHGLYETLPAPAIALERVMQDFAASQRGANGDDAWMIPDIAPRPPTAARADAPDPQRRDRQQRRRRDEEGEADPDVEGGNEGEEQDDEPEPAPVAPTVNLLGWRRSVTLTANQRYDIEQVIDKEDDNRGVINRRYAIRRELFDLVSRRLRECKHYKMSPIPSTTGGSQCQQFIWKPIDFTTSRFQMAIESEGVAMSPTFMPLRAVVAAKIMCYKTLRCEHEQDDGVAVNSWACFHFNRYSQVPHDWIENRNAVANPGHDGLINYTQFKTPITSRVATLVKYLTKKVV